MTVREALNTALDEEMAADRNVILMGEEVVKYCIAVLDQYLVQLLIVCFCNARLGNIKVHTRCIIRRPSLPHSLLHT